MLQLIDKKILCYIFIFFSLGTINNKNLINFDLFKVKEITLIGTELSNQSELLEQLEIFKFMNIFKVNKLEIENLISKNELIENFYIFKKYPSKLLINIERTNFLANLNLDNKFYYIGSNKKLIKAETIDKDLPIIFGKPKIQDFFNLYEKVKFSNLKFTNIKNLYFFPSKRWDLEFNNGNVLRLSHYYTIDDLNNYIKVLELKKLNTGNIFDMRIKNQMIINELN